MSAVEQCGDKAIISFECRCLRCRAYTRDWRSPDQTGQIVRNAQSQGVRRPRLSLLDNQIEVADILSLCKKHIEGVNDADVDGTAYESLGAGRADDALESVTQPQRVEVAINPC